MNINVKQLPQYHLPANFYLNRSYLDLLKWFALFAMALCHIGISVMVTPPEIFSIVGKLAFPLFGFILGYNLALAVSNNDFTVEKRLMRTLLVFGCFSQPFYWNFVHSPLPLNVMFSLALGVYMVFNHKHPIAWFALGVCGLFVEGGWLGALFVLASYLLATDILNSKISVFSGAMFLLSMISFAIMTSSPYPLLLLPLLQLGLSWKPAFLFPRCKWFFYAFYPVHLALLPTLLYFK